MPQTDRSQTRSKTAMKWTGITALFGMAALSPLSMSSADPGADGAPAPVTVTATVTAHVAPDQCDPVPDGQLPQRAVDYASDGSPITPDPSIHPEPPAADATSTVAPVADKKPVNPTRAAGKSVIVAVTSAKQAPADADELDDAPRAAEEGGSEVSGSGVFDPYLCEATPATTSTSATTPSAPVTTERPRLEDVPGVTSVLPQLPGGSDPEGGGNAEYGTTKSQAPTTTMAPGGAGYPAIGAPRP